MADEQKEVVETPQKETPAKPEAVEEGEHIDYQALYEEEKGRRAKAESVIQRHKTKPADEQLPEKEEEVETVSVDTLRTIIRNEVDDLRGALTSQFREKEIGDAISRVATDAHHAALIRYQYENGIRLSGDLSLDIENASALANKPRIQSQLEEMKAALDSRGARSLGSQTWRKPKVEADDETLPALTDVDRQTVNWLREKYVVSNQAIRQILKGVSLDDLLANGVMKKR